MNSTVWLSDESFGGSFALCDDDDGCAAPPPPESAPKSKKPDTSKTPHEPKPEPPPNPKLALASLVEFFEAMEVENPRRHAFAFMRAFPNCTLRIPDLATVERLAVHHRIEESLTNEQRAGRPLGQEVRRLQDHYGFGPKAMAKRVAAVVESS